MTRNAWNMRRWWQESRAQDTPPRLNMDMPVPPAQDEHPQEAWPDTTPQLSDATPRDEKTVGDLALTDRGCIVEVKSAGLTVRGFLQDIAAEHATERYGYYRAPEVISGPVTLTITGFTDYSQATVTVAPTDPITIIRRRT